jgi:hypothetical protein
MGYIQEGILVPNDGQKIDRRHNQALPSPNQLRRQNVGHVEIEFPGLALLLPYKQLAQF